jgi:hypothetical protein
MTERKSFKSFAKDGEKNIVGSRQNNYTADPTSTVGTPAGNNCELIESLNNFTNGLQGVTVSGVKLDPL